MQTRSNNPAQKFVISQAEAAEALMKLKKGVSFSTRVSQKKTSTWPSGRPRRSTAGYVNYDESD
jgi:hypothetical protein